LLILNDLPPFLFLEYSLFFTLTLTIPRVTW
jgi:hypothetical protein